MPELSIIVPYVLEWPQIVFTLRSIAEELEGRVDFELIAVDNFCDEVAKQGKTKDKTEEHVRACSKGQPWLKSLSYTDKLSHWQSKNLAVQASTGKFLWFCDSHCIVRRDSLFNMFQYYKTHHAKLNGTLHLPLSYHILEYHKLIYKLVWEPKIGNIHYSFTGYKDKKLPYRMPCMSTCGMMMTRQLYDDLGGWPKEMGIYGGGENFINYTLAVLGKSINIFPGPQLCHHGDKRQYHWYGDDYVRNRCIANYMFGGVDLARRFVDNRKGSRRVLYKILNNVLDNCEPQRNHIKSQQVMTIEDWSEQWR